MIPRIELTENEILWLKEAWRLLCENGEPPSYKTLRLNMVEKTGDDFDPHSIHKWLIINRATEITFLGLFHISGESVLKDAENILLLIKKKLRRADHQEEFLISDLASELSLDEKYAKILFALLTEFGSIYNGATAPATVKSKFGYNNYRINSDEVFEAYLSFNGLESKIENHYGKISQSQGITALDFKTVGNRDLWLDSNGELHVNDSSGVFNRVFLNQRIFISQSRIKEIMSVKSNRFDFLKLLHLFKEINFNYMYGNYYAVALLSRALIDHVPPIFGCANFNEVTNNYKSENNSQSFKKAMSHLHNSLRNIGDSSIHSQIRKSEVAPNEIQLDFKNDLDVLLAEIVRILK